MVNEYEVKILEVIERIPGVKSVRVEHAGGVAFKAGQFLCVQSPDGKTGKRYLSISNSPTEKGYLEFTKRITQSDFSRMLDGMRPNDRLRIQYPFGKFTVDDPKEKIAFLSGGIGITPIRSICKCAVDEQWESDLVLLYANRSFKDIIFREDFEQMERHYKGLRVTHVLCEPSPGFTCTVGLINSQVVRQEIPDYGQRKFFLCGPPAMVEAMKKLLGEELAVRKENIVTENFQGY